MANAGNDQNVEVGSSSILDGSHSFDPDEEDELQYEWAAAPENPAVIMFNPQSRIISISPTVPGTYQFTLTVSDGKDDNTDTVTIIVHGADNTAPVANAGPPIDGSRIASNTVDLDGLASFDADGDPITYLWTVTHPDTVVAIDDAATAMTFFVAPLTGTYVVTLTVSDGQASSSEVLTISVELPNNQPPLADAGTYEEIIVGTQVMLDGSASADPEDEPLVYSWSISGPVEPELMDSDTAQPRFTPTVKGLYTVRLSVSDGVNDSQPTSASQASISVVTRQFAELDGMIEIPAGPFTMGSDDGLAGEAPAHQIELSAFWIDQFEVTTAEYQACSGTGACSDAPRSPNLCNASGGRDNHPVNCVTWSQALAYCQAQDKRLPTEAEWEKAARGTDARRFPWGNDAPTPLRLNFNTEGTAAAGMTPDGASFYGVEDMSGNVLEWTADWFQIDHYSQRVTTTDPQGPPTSTHSLRVIRGSAYNTGGFDEKALTATVRSGRDPVLFDPVIGFRCARSGE